MRRMAAGTRARVTGACSAVIAAASVVVVVAPHLPWYVATQSPPGGGPPAPEGTATGLSGHDSLWAVIVLTFVQLVLLLARHVPGGRLRVPGDRVWLALSAAVVCFSWWRTRTSCRPRGFSTSTSPANPLRSSGRIRTCLSPAPPRR